MRIAHSEPAWIARHSYSTYSVIGIVLYSLTSTINNTDWLRTRASHSRSSVHRHTAVDFGDELLNRDMQDPGTFACCLRSRSPQQIASTAILARCCCVAAATAWTPTVALQGVTGWLYMHRRKASRSQKAATRNTQVASRRRGSTGKADNHICQSFIIRP